MAKRRGGTDMRKTVSIYRVVFCVLAICAILVMVPTLSGAQEETASIDPEAARLLLQMAEHVQALKEFSFHTENAIDVVVSAGMKLQFAESVDMHVRRPDRFLATARGDLRTQNLYYDGKTITLLNPDLKYYGQIEAPSTIHPAFDYALDSFGIEAPMADFIPHNVGDRLEDLVEFGFYVGLTSINGVECHHLAFVEDEVDWQIWIENSERRLPRKIIITSKMVAGAPQFTALFSDWKLSAKLPDSLFAFKKPEGAERINFLPVSITITAR
jgi:hypothetical protein